MIKDLHRLFSAEKRKWQSSELDGDGPVKIKTNLLQRDSLLYN